MSAINADSSRKETLFNEREFARPSTAIGAGVLVGSAIACAMLVIYILIGMAVEGMSAGMAYCLSFIAAGIAGGILQQIWFNWETLMLRITYAVRVVGFALTYYVVLLGCAIFGGWFPVNPSRVLVFSAIFLFILVVLTLCFRRAYQKRDREYAEKLAEYKASKGR